MDKSATLQSEQRLTIYYLCVISLLIVLASQVRRISTHRIRF